MFNYQFETHPIIRILSLSKFHKPSDTKSPFLQFSRKINKYQNHFQANNSTQETKGNINPEPLKIISDITSLLQSLKIRSFTQEELHKIYYMISNDSALVKMDDTFEFAFPFFNDCLENITFESIKNLIIFFQNLCKTKEHTTCDFHIDKTNEDVIESLSIIFFFIFMSALSWMVNSERIKTSEGITLLLEKVDLIFKFFIDYPDLNSICVANSSLEFIIDFSQVKSLSIDTFLYSLYYADNNFTDFSFTNKIFDCLNTFYFNLISNEENKMKPKPTNLSKQSKNPQKSNSASVDTGSDTLLNSLYVLFSCLSIEINRSSNKVPGLCNFISQVVENITIPNFFTNKLYWYIFHQLVGKLSEMNEVILQFFVGLSAKFEEKDEKILSHFPIFLSLFLKKSIANPIKIVKEGQNEEFDDNAIVVTELNDAPIINYRSAVQNFQFSFIEGTFENGLTLVQTAEVPPSLRTILPKEIVSRIDLISELYEGMLFTKQFSTILADIDKENNFELFLLHLAAFLSTCEDEKGIELSFIIDIFNSPLFTGKYEDKNKKFISALFYYSISLLMHCDSLNVLIEPIIKSKFYFPTVLTEIFQDLNIVINYNSHLYNIKEINGKVNQNNYENIYAYFTSQKFIKLFYDTSLFYQTANINDKKNTEEIEKCRISLILFMESFVQKWSESSNFTLMFFSYLFEPSLQPFVLSHLKSLCESDKCDISAFETIFETCQALLNPKEQNDNANMRSMSISLMFELLKVINSLILHPDAKKQRCAFVPLHKPLSNILLKLTKDEIEFICEIIEYFSLTSDQNTIDPDTIQTFSDAIQKIGMTNEIRLKLIRLLAGNQAPSIVSHFLIEQPFALPLFVTLFISKKNSELLNDNFNLLERLVTFSKQNAIMCHKGNLDLVLLDFIDNCISILVIKENHKKKKTNLPIENKVKTQLELELENYLKMNKLNENAIYENIDEDEDENKGLMNISLFRKDLMQKDKEELKKEINDAMSLVIKIALIESSILIVRKYISLLSRSIRTKAFLLNNEDVNNAVFKKMADFYFNNFIDIISNKFKMPTTFLPINTPGTPVIEIDNISSSHFLEGFTANFWVYLVQQSVKKPSILFTLTDSNNHEITVKIIDTSILVMFLLNMKKITYTLSTTFPLEQWFLISINLIKNKADNEYTISASVNTTPIEYKCSISYFELEGAIKIVINGGDEHSAISSNKISSYRNKHPPMKRCSSIINYDMNKKDEHNKKVRSGSLGFLNEICDDDNNKNTYYRETNDEGALLGPFGFFQPLLTSNIIQMQQSGPRSIPKMNVKKIVNNSNKMININSSLAPTLLSCDYNYKNDHKDDSTQSITKIIYIYFDKINGMFNVVRDMDTTSTRYTIKISSKYYQPLSFDEILVQYFKIQSLIPLFKYEEEKADEIVSLFSMVLSLGKFAQINFYHSHGFSIISHILKHYNPKHLTYSLYSKFTNLSNQIIVEELKNDLIQNILARFDLWCLSSSNETKLRIIKQWLQINPNFDTYFLNNYKTFDDVLFSLDYFESIQLKTYLLKLIFRLDNKNEMISLENTNTFIEFIIYQAKNMKANVSYLLEFLKNNCKYFSASNLFINLSSILSTSTNENNIFFIIIELFDDLYRSKKIKAPQKYELVGSFVDIIPLELFNNNDNILKLIEYSKRIPEYLMILFYGMAFYNDSANLPSNSSSSNINANDNFGNNSMKSKILLIAENLKATSSYCFSKNWYLWPIVAAYKINNNFFTQFIFNFIVNSIPEEFHAIKNYHQDLDQEQQQRNSISSIWEEIFILIDIVGESFSSYLNNNKNDFEKNKLKENTFDLMKSFLSVLFLKEKKGAELVHFLKLCVFCLFFKPTWFKNKAMIALFDESPFDNSSPSRTSDIKMHLRDLNKQKLFDQIKETCKLDRHFKFSLRFGQDENWIDYDFAIQILEELKHIPEFGKINNILKYFISRQNALDDDSSSFSSSSTSSSAIISKNYDIYEAIQTMSSSVSQMNKLFNLMGNSVTKEFSLPSNKSLIKSQKSSFDRKMEKIDDLSYRYWSQLWKSMNAESMPWRLYFDFNVKEENKIKLDNDEVDNNDEYYEFNDQLCYHSHDHWKIDCTPCSAFCPMKLKKDFHYIQHKSLREVQLIELQDLYKKHLLHQNKKNYIETENLMKNIIEKEQINSHSQVRKKKNRQQQQKQSKKQKQPFSFFSFMDEDLFNLPSSERTSNEIHQNLPIKIKCELITIKRKMKGRCYFYNDKIELTVTKPISNNNASDEEQKSSNKKNVEKIIVIYYHEIRLILSRMILHRPTGIEIFTLHNDSYLLNFPRSTSSLFLSKLMSICSNKNIFVVSYPSNLGADSGPFMIQSNMFNSSNMTIGNSVSSIFPNISSYLSCLTDGWKNGIVSNFDYLIGLNMLSGRSFNDPSMYPVFPWIVSDYSSKTIRWNEKDFYRDLSLPVGALNSERLSELLQRRDEMVQFDNEIVFLYGAGYSTPISLFNWLIRLEPFATLHIQTQDGHFDHPQRLFYSIEASYKLSTSNTNDYRELIPEFFFLPDFLVNKNHFNFGFLKDDMPSLEMIHKHLSKEDLIELESKEDEINNEDKQNEGIKDDTNSGEDDQKRAENEENESEKDKTDINKENLEDKQNDSTENNEENSSNNAEQAVVKDGAHSSIEKKEDHSEKYERSGNERREESLRINDAILPSWASSPLDFIYKHRKILESKHVSRHLNEWIDNIFGVGQRNNENNQFHPWMYSDVWEKRQQLVKQRQRIRKTNFSYESSPSATESSFSFADIAKESENPEQESNETVVDASVFDNDDGIPTEIEIEDFLTECGQIPQQLFFEKHPVKLKAKRHSYLHKPIIASKHFSQISASMSVSALERILFASFVKKEKRANSDQADKLIFAYVTNDGHLMKAAVSPDGIECVPNDRIDKSARIDSSLSSVKEKYQIFKGYFAVTSEEGTVQVFNFNTGALVKELKEHIGKVNCLASDQLLFVSCGSDTSTNIYDMNFSLRFSIPSFRDEIVTSYVNSLFNVVANITLDSSLILISTSTGTITKVISFHDRKPLSVIITNAWGFVVVFAEETLINNKKKEKSQPCKFLLLYSINGDKICERKIESFDSIACWLTFTSFDGFDFIALCDDKGDLFVFEVYPFISSSNLDDDQKSEEILLIFKSEMPIKNLFYWSENRSIVGIGSNGNAFFVPI